MKVSEIMLPNTLYLEGVFIILSLHMMTFQHTICQSIMCFILIVTYFNLHLGKKNCRTPTYQLSMFGQPVRGWAECFWDSHLYPSMKDTEWVESAMSKPTTPG